MNFDFSFLKSDTLSSTARLCKGERKTHDDDVDDRRQKLSSPQVKTLPVCKKLASIAKGLERFRDARE